MQYVQHFSYYRQDRRITVELHWRFCANPCLFPLKFDDAWNAREDVDLAGARVPTLSMEHTVLYLCVHGANHCWHRLFWLNDIAALQCKFDAIDWTVLSGSAAELGVLRPLEEGMILANFLLGTPLPEPVRIYAAQDRVIHYLVRAALRIAIDSRELQYRPFNVQGICWKLHVFLLRRDLRYRLVFFLFFPIWAAYKVFVLLRSWIKIQPKGEIVEGGS
jgi:hypothetical protein